MNAEYTKKLEAVIKQMLTPLKDVPLKLVIEVIAGCRIIPFDRSDIVDARLLDDLKKTAVIAGSEFNKLGVARSRPNEIGNDIEPFVIDALNQSGYRAAVPITAKGKKKSAGYPDIELVDDSGRTSYLECKTFNIENVDTTQRSFYLSPSTDFKITKDAHHFAMSFEVSVAGRRKNKNLYKCRSWKVLTLDELDVDVKYEFNTDNKRLYAEKLVLAEGKL
ncbi:MAG: hypothetical protein A3J24_02555 [Deltaproteobacteria bacterium RIFCSPLOWO2_02_FULL_53_8]|nr:MAG: hypothetical protein A3J24_02555 [Deltaproteobacteria bacterium RIFCSPLOWO2_02_FULL_53_8]